MSPYFPPKQHRKETVTVILTANRPASIAVWDGVAMQDYTNPNTKVVTSQKAWVFLPKSAIEVSHKEQDIDLGDKTEVEALVGKEISVTASESLLTEKGLI